MTPFSRPILIFCANENGAYLDYADVHEYLLHEYDYVNADHSHNLNVYDYGAHHRENVYDYAQQKDVYADVYVFP